MRHIGTLPDESQARTFEDYLLVQGIRSDVERDGDGWSVWIHEEDDVPPAKSALDEFREHPDAPAFQSVSEEAAQRRREIEKRNERFRQQQIDMRQRWQRPAAASAPVTMAMIAISVVVVVFGSSWNNFMHLCDRTEPLLTWLYIAPVFEEGGAMKWQPGRGLEAIRQGQVWRLVTPIFLHFGVFHILFNMLWLRDLGTAVEFRRGSLRFLGVVLAIAVASNLSQYFVNRMHGGGPNFGGMSGVVFGLFGYIWMKSRYEPNAGFFLPSNIVFLMIAWFIICLTGAVGPIANTAHGMGLAVGMILGVAPTVWRQLAGG